jgi:putative tributyrin esterase
LLAPETFGYAASLSGGLDAVACSENPIPGSTLWEDIFGPHEQVAGSDNDLFAVAERLAASDRPKPSLYMWCGTEDFLYDQNVRMRDHLLKLNYDLVYEESAGDHEWKYWDEKIQTVLKWLPVRG